MTDTISNLCIKFESMASPSKKKVADLVVKNILQIGKKHVVDQDDNV